ncbi:hypothetical protein OFB62_29070, partial [Escherichia coli]|nr:hypothetical protein [Escherichia coli]
AHNRHIDRQSLRAPTVVRAELKGAPPSGGTHSQIEARAAMARSADTYESAEKALIAMPLNSSSEASAAAPKSGPTKKPSVAVPLTNAKLT